MAATATPRPTRVSQPVEERQPSGWTLFAGSMMLLVGLLDATYGLAAILNNQIIVVGGQGVMLADVTTWGWVHLGLGSLVALTGVGLFFAMPAARWAALFFVIANALAQIVWFTAAPLWAFLIILLDAMIIYELSVRWQD